MNWPWWILPFILPLAAAQIAWSWFVGRVVRGDRFWNATQHERDVLEGRAAPSAGCPCRACREVGKSR